MSVPENKREHGKLEALTQARKLKAYTIEICSNEKSFPKRYRWCLTNQVIADANEICRLIVLANAVKVENEVDKSRRLCRQKEAYELTEVLLEDIDSSYSIFHLTVDRASFWIQQVCTLQKLLKGWIRSDAERYTKG